MHFESNNTFENHFPFHSSLLERKATAIEPGYQLIIEESGDNEVANLAVIKDSVLLLGEFPCGTDLCVGINAKQLIRLIKVLWPDEESKDSPLTRIRLHAALDHALRPDLKHRPKFIKVPAPNDHQKFDLWTSQTLLDTFQPLKVSLFKLGRRKPAVA